MKRLLLTLLLIPAAIQAQDFRHRYFHYNQLYDAPAPFTILANTADAADSNYVQIGGGGAAASTRGAFVEIDGNEVAGASGGRLLFSGGDIATGGSIAFNTGTNGRRITIPYSADADDADLVFGNATPTTPTYTIRGQTADNDDDGVLTICASGACGDTRGAYISLRGNEATSGGQFTFVSGGSGNMLLNPGGYTGVTFIYTGDDNSAVLGFGTSTPTLPVFTIRARSSDGDDDGSLKLAAGGAVGTTRGADITLRGDDIGGAGAGGGINYEAGTGTTAYHSFLGAGTEKWRIEADGDLASNATTGGNLVFQKDTTGIVDSTEPTTPTGADLAGAALITANVTFVDTDADTKGVKFPAAPVGGTRYVIYNTDAALHVHIYPGEAGDQINSLGAGNSLTLDHNEGAYCHAASASQIYCMYTHH